MPSLPVDSAISCSTHSPKLAIGSETTNVSLSRRWSASAPIAMPSHRPGVRRRAVVVRAVLLRHLAPVQQAADVRAHQDRRDDPEVGHHRVAAADLRVVAEHPPEAVLLGQLLERAARVGDRHELRPVPARLLEEVAEVRQRLDRPARLRRDEEERLRDVDGALELGHRAGIGRVEHVQPQPVLQRAERAPDHLGPEARPAHAEQRAVGEAVALHAPRPTPRGRCASSSIDSLIVSQPSRSATSGAPASPQSVSSLRQMRWATSSDLASRPFSAIRRLEVVGDRALDRRRDGP